MRRVLAFLPALLLALTIVVTARARSEDTPPAPVVERKAEPAAPSAAAQRVSVGMYLKEVPQIDLKTNSYLADFYLWFRWSGAIDPTKSFEFTNGVEHWDVLAVPIYAEPETLPDGTRYQIFHIQGRFSHAFPLHDYPFDQQDIIIEIEDREHRTSELAYVADDEATNFHEGIEIPGWQLDGVVAEVSEASYRSNFGDPRIQPGADVYSHYAFSLRISRPVFGYLVKTVLPIAIVILITFVAFFVPSKYFEGRLGLAITSLVSAVALQLTSGADLPSVGYMVLLDEIYNVSYAIILLTLVESMVAVRLFDAGQEARAQRLDRLALAVLSTMFFGGVALIVLLR